MARRYPATGHQPPFLLLAELVADVLHELADFAAGLAEAVLDIPRGALAGTFLLQIDVAGGASEVLLDRARDLIQLAADFVLVPHQLVFGVHWCLLTPSIYCRKRSK
jgi:hypothetical protein